MADFLGKPKLGDDSGAEASFTSPQNQQRVRKNCTQNLFQARTLTSFEELSFAYRTISIIVVSPSLITLSHFPKGLLSRNLQQGKN